MKNLFKKTWEKLGLRGTITALFLALVLIVGFQNMEPVDIDFLFWDAVEVSKLVFIFALLSIGFVIGLITGWRRSSD